MECITCGSFYYALPYAVKINRTLFCSIACLAKGSYPLKLATRLKKPLVEVLNALQASLKWCWLGKHWAHIVDFWPDRTHQTYLNKHTYCKICYGKSHNVPNARMNVTKSDSWKRALLTLLETNGSINKSLQLINVSWPTYTSRRKENPEFEKQIHDAKRTYFKKYGSEVRDFAGWHKPSYEARSINEETKSFYEKNKSMVEGWIKSAAFAGFGIKAEPVIGDIINLAVQMFVYTRFLNVRNPGRLVRFYGRCAGFRILKNKE